MEATAQRERILAFEALIENKSGYYDSMDKILDGLNEEIPQLVKEKMDMKNRDVDATKSIDIAHYLLRILFWIWIVIGLWSSQSEMFMFLGQSQMQIDV